MIFSDDAILMTLLSRYEDEQDIKDAVMSYCNRGAVSASKPKREEPAPMKAMSFMKPVQQ
jgi:hypothetical protein